jgi:hypothetical protein
MKFLFESFQCLLSFYPSGALEKDQIPWPSFLAQCLAGRKGISKKSSAEMSVSAFTRGTNELFRLPRYSKDQIDSALSG